MLSVSAAGEPVIMKTTNIDLASECILIVELKKHNRKRTIYKELYIINGRRYKCFKNWLDYWQPEVENHYNKDYLYLKPDGKPFTTETMRQLLNRKATPIL